MTSHSFRRLGRDTLLYGFGQVASRLASVIMLPIYTRLLSPSDYGILQLLDMTVDIVSILVSAGTTAGVMRFYFKTDDAETRRRLLAGAFLLQTGLNLLGTGLMIAAAPLIHRELLDGARDVSLVYFAAANFTLAGILNVPLLAMQLEGRAALQTGTALSRLLLQLSLNILFLVQLGLGPKGILLSNFTATLLVGGLAAAWLLRRTGLRTTRAALADLRRFGVPYQLTTAGSFILTFGDRFFLEHAHGLAEVGLYGLSYSFGFLLAGVTYIPYLTAWTPLRHAITGSPQAQRDAVYNRGLLFMSLLTTGGAAGIALFVRPALQIMSNADFHAAAFAVPLILVAIILQSWTDVVKFGIDVSERTALVTRGTWLSALAILGLYALLIPPFGAIGAGLATALAFLLRLTLFMRSAESVWPARYDWRPSLRLLAAFGAAVVVNQSVAPPDPIGGGAVAAVCFAGFALVALRELPADDRRRIAASVRSPGDLVNLLKGT